MKKKKISYKQSVELVLTHLKATKDQWNINARGSVRRNHYTPVETPAGNIIFHNNECCPISSLANKSADFFLVVGQSFNLDKKAIEDIVEAADYSLTHMKSYKELPFSKAVLDIRRRIDRILR